MKKIIIIFYIVFGTLAAQAQSSVTYTVSNGNSSGAGSFADVINQINALSTLTDVTVNFNANYGSVTGGTIANANLNNFTCFFAGTSTTLNFGSYACLSSSTNKLITVDNMKGQLGVKNYQCSNSFSVITNLKIQNNSTIYVSSMATIGLEFNTLEIIQSEAHFYQLTLCQNFISTSSDIDFMERLQIKNTLAMNQTVVKGLNNSDSYGSYIYLYPSVTGFSIQSCYFNCDRNFVPLSATNLNSLVIKGFTPNFINFLLSDSYFVGNYKTGLNLSELNLPSGALLVRNNYFGHPSYLSYGAPKVSVKTDKKITLFNNKFYNADTVLTFLVTNPSLQYDSANTMTNCTNGIFIKGYSNSIAVTNIDTITNTISGSCNCDKVQIWKNGNINTKLSTGESYVTQVPCISNTWTYTNTSGITFRLLTFMEKTSSNTNGNFSNWQNFDLGDDIVKCPSLAIPLDASIFGAYNYSWSNGDTIPAINVVDAGNYKVTFKDFFGNIRTDSIKISVDSDISSLDIGSDSTICQGDSVFLRSNILSGVTFLWNNGKTTNSIYAKTIGWHKLTIKDSCQNISVDSVFITLNTLCGKIKGKVYYDNDSTCTFNGVDKAYKNIMVKALPGNHYTFTDASGNYTFLLPPDTYTISVVTGADWRIKCPSGGIHTVPLPAYATISNKDFSLLNAKNLPDLSVHYSTSVTRPLRPVTYYLSYTNTGKLASGTVQFTLPDSVAFTSAAPAYTSVNGKSYSWNFTNLYPGETRYITLDGTIITNTIGSSLASCSRISPTITDYDSTNNNYCRTAIVRGAIDPNDLQVSPQGLTQEGYIEHKDSVLTYTVRFQNVGTDTAFTVIITDTLSSNVNFETVRVLEASHNYYMQQTNNGILRFKFNKINLPDSSVNQVKSNGFITFKVNLKPNLAHGTVVKNRATIVFDTQNGLMTNEVKNTIINYLPTITGNNTASCAGDTISLTATVQGGSYLWSNGDTTQVIKITTAGNYSYQFTDSLGFEGQSTSINVFYPAMIQSTQNITICAGESVTVGANSYNSSGSYTDVFSAANGCDSTVTTNLTVNSVNTAVVMDVVSLTAQANAASYQWIDCSNGFSPISGETNQSFTASANGDYAVIITENSCSDTSACYAITQVGLRRDVSGQYDRLRVYPNPASGEVTVRVDASIPQHDKVEIWNAVGVKMLEVRIKKLDKEISIDISDLTKGMYVLKVGSDAVKLVVE